MSATRVALSGVKCKSCQQRALYTFIGLPNLATATSRPSSNCSYAPRKYFATNQRLKNEDNQNHNTGSRIKSSQIEPEPLAKAAETGTTNTIREEEVFPSQVTSGSQDPTVPWYLQEQDDTSSAGRLMSRQQVPNLPHEAPENLGAMVEYIFKDIGLDDMRILDLRKLDPPPALGSNLIMILGTARSEKHLHISADRFCRWVRSTFKLRPFPDGLLGRNELKLKLRRKAKRAKLLGSKGPVDDEADDGIRTGWICVNVGAIENGTTVNTTELHEAGRVGFGGTEDGAHLIVQMMTEEKREELDLEKLWLDALARQERKEAREAVMSESSEAVPSQDVQVGPNGDRSATSADRSPSSHRPVIMQHLGGQLRSFHTQRRLLRANLEFSEDMADDTSKDSNFKNIELESRAIENWKVLEENGMKKRIREFWSIERPKLSEPYEFFLRTLASLHPRKSISILSGQRTDGGIEVPEQCFSEDPSSSDVDLWICRLWVECFGMLIGHPKYSSKRIQGLFNLMEDSLPAAPDHLFKLAVDTFVPCRLTYENAMPRYPPIDKTTIAFIVRAIANIQSLNPEVGDKYVFERLYLAKVRSLLNPVQPNTSLSSSAVVEQLDQVYSALTCTEMPRLSEAFHLNVLDALGGLPAGNESFFKHWESIPIYSDSRTTSMYALFFNYLAATENPHFVSQNLSEWIEMMDTEDPPVPLEGKVAAAVVDCLKILDPDIESAAKQNPADEKFNISLWRKCHGYWDSEDAVF